MWFIEITFEAIIEAIFEAIFKTTFYRKHKITFRSNAVVVLNHYINVAQAAAKDDAGDYN